jgi:hypothetical protein
MARTVSPSCNRTRRQGRLQEALHQMEIQTGRGWAAEPSPGDHAKKARCLEDRPPGAAAGGSPICRAESFAFGPGLVRRFARERARAQPARSTRDRWRLSSNRAARRGFASPPRISSPAAKPGLASGLWFAVLGGFARLTPLPLVPICAEVLLRVGLCGSSGPRRRRRRGGWQRPRGGRGGSPERIGTHRAG